MARRTNLAKKKERSLLPETGNPSADMVETTIPSMGGAQLKPANGNDSGKVDQEPKTETNSVIASMLGKGRQTVNVGVRRSIRLQGMVTPACFPDIHQVVQEIALSGSENEDEEEEEPPAYEETKRQGPCMGNKNLEDKIDYLVQLMEGQQDRSSPYGSPTLSYSGYKRLYIDSQIKIEALTEENRQLSMRLEKALGKLEAYDKGPHDYSEVLEKVLDIIKFINPTTGHEAKSCSPKRMKLRERKDN